MLEDGVTVYPMTPEEFASWGPALLKQVQDSSADAVALPQNIFECLLKKFRASQQKLHATYIQLCLLQRERVRNRSLTESSFVIGERINPTGKKNCRKNFVPENLTL